jgi:hypothetical protein
MVTGVEAPSLWPAIQLPPSILSNASFTSNSMTLIFQAEDIAAPKKAELQNLVKK